MRQSLTTKARADPAMKCRVNAHCGSAHIFKETDAGGSPTGRRVNEYGNLSPIITLTVVRPIAIYRQGSLMRNPDFLGQPYQIS
jgi:hypothetical protein